MILKINYRVKRKLFAYLNRCIYYNTEERKRRSND